MTVKAIVKVPVTNSTVSLIDIRLLRALLNGNKFQFSFFKKLFLTKVMAYAAYCSLAHRKTATSPYVFYHTTEETALCLLSWKGGHICKAEGTTF